MDGLVGHRMGSSLVMWVHHIRVDSVGDKRIQVTPEAQVGGPIALVKDGDSIVIHATTRKIQWLVSDSEQAARRKEWEVSGKKPLKERRGVLFRYARDVAVSIRRSCFVFAVSRADCSQSLQMKAPTRTKLYRQLYRLLDWRAVPFRLRNLAENWGRGTITLSLSCLFLGLLRISV